MIIFHILLYMYIILRLWSWTPISICQSIINLSSATCKLFWLFISGHAIYEYLQDTYLINFWRKNFKILKLFLYIAKLSQRRPFNFTLIKIQRLICNLVKGRVSWHLNELTWVSNLILNWIIGYPFQSWSPSLDQNLVWWWIDFRFS